MPKFDIVLRLDEHEKEQLRGACDTKTITAAIKAHEAQAKENTKVLSAMLRDKVHSDELELANEAIPALRSLVEALADSEEKTHALSSISQAESTLEEISQAQESLTDLQRTAANHGVAS